MKWGGWVGSGGVRKLGEVGRYSGLGGWVSGAEVRVRRLGGVRKLGECGGWWSGGGELG